MTDVPSLREIKMRQMTVVQNKKEVEEVKGNKNKPGNKSGD